MSLQGSGQLSARIYRQIRDAILDGRLRAGAALPSTRELARRLQVSRNTVMLAYERLRAEGFLESRVGGGTFVSDGVLPRAPSGPAGSPLAARAVWDEIPDALDMSAWRPALDFRPGIPDAGRFPFAAFRARLARQLGSGAVGAGAPIGAAGHPALRAAIARHVSISRGVRARDEDVFVTNGIQQGLDLIARVLLDPGDEVAVEDPGYRLPRHLFHAHGCRVTGVPVDAEGLVVDAIPDGARLVYVTPSHQYPLGMAMSMARRQALIEWAERRDAVLVEDDYDSEFRYGGRPLEPLQGFDRFGRVLYLGSFSKVMFPTLRLGFLVAPPPLHAALRKARFVTDWHTAVPVQAATALFIDDGLLAQHLRRMRRVYAERHELVRSLLTRDFAGCLTPLPSTGGLHLTAVLAQGLGGVDDHTLAERASAVGVAVFPLSRHYASRPARQGLLFGYGAIAAERIEEGLRRLRQCC